MLKGKTAKEEAEIEFNKYKHLNCYNNNNLSVY